MTEKTSSLAPHARAFSSIRTARIMAPLVGLAVGARLKAGKFKKSDALVAGAILAAEPFTEWGIHVFVLHFKPKKWRGRTIDLDIAEKHRTHHRNPRDLSIVGVPMRTMYTAVPLGIVLPLALVPDKRRALTGVTTGLGMLFAYEWTHYLIHTSYLPKRAFYRRLWRHHRLHHFRNENYWFGVTMVSGDRVLGTRPAKDEVPASDTARTLGIAS